jgi:acetyltransferase-like isoleucine patch superfamily enzyme
VLPGAVVESGCVVAAGAVVTGHCLADGVYAGVPARRLRDVHRSTLDRNA